jgi:alginate export protein
VRVLKVLWKAKTTVLLGSTLALFLHMVQAPDVGGAKGGPSIETVSATNPANQAIHPANEAPGLNQHINDQGITKQQPIMRPDGSVLTLRKSPFTIENVLGGPQWLHLGVEHRTRYETYNQPFRLNQIGSDQQIPIHTLVRMGIRNDPIRFFVEFMDARAFLTDNGSTDAKGAEDETDILQLYGGLGSTNLFGLGVPAELSVGRFSMDFGHRRLIRRGNFRNAPLAFTGVHLALGEKKLYLRSFVVQPVFQFENKGDTEEHGTTFWGFSLGQRQIPWLNTDLYVYFLNESDRPPNTDSRRRHFQTPGLRVFKPNAVGQMDYEIESIWQFGNLAAATGSSQTLDHFAHFQHLEIGYTFDIPWTPRFLFQYDYASGDRNPNDNKDQRFDSLFGGVNFELNPGGIWRPFRRSNINSPGYRLYLTPSKNFSFFAAHRIFWLANARDQWVGTGLQDRSGNSGKYLGHHFEARGHWIATKNVVFETGWAYLLKGSFIENLNQPGKPNNKNSTYFYVSTTLRF